VVALFDGGVLLRRPRGHNDGGRHTAVARWRSQTIAWALDHAADRAFWSWAQDTTSRWAAEDVEARNLFAAELNADLTGEHGA
jgi:hypothetical protein